MAHSLDKVVKDVAKLEKAAAKARTAEGKAKILRSAVLLIDKTVKHQLGTRSRRAA